MIDLKELMNQRSADPPLPGGPRLRHVERRIVTRRHRRMTTGVVCAVMAIASLGYLIQPADLPMPDAAAPPTPRIINGFPEYDNGYRVIDAVQGPVADRVVSLRFTPTGTEFAIWFDCRDPAPHPEQTYGDLTLNGVLWMETEPCGIFLGSSLTLEQRGIAPGTPVTVSYRLTRATYQGRPTVLPRTGFLKMAIAVPVPFSEWPFPPRPANLPVLEDDITQCPSEGRVYHLRSDPADPLRPVELTVSWDRYNQSWISAQTPGIFTISVDGVEVNTTKFWDYSGRGSGFELLREDFGPDAPALGDQVTLSVTPRHATGQWLVTTMFNGPDSSMCGLHRGRPVEMQLGLNPWPENAK